MVADASWWRDAAGGGAGRGGTAPWGTTYYPKLRDRLASSIVNARLPFIYSTSAVGFVLRPSAVQGALWCSYPRDGNSMSEANHGCSSKGLTGSFHTLSRMMEYQQNHLRFSTSCLWGEPDVEDRSGCRYNEVVLDAYKYEASLPRVIEAVFFPEHAVVHHREGDEPRARLVHRSLLRAYGLAGARDRAEVPPLLAFDVQLAQGGHAPFREVSVDYT